MLTSFEHPLLPKLYQVYNAGNEFCIAMTVGGGCVGWRADQHDAVYVKRLAHLSCIPCS